MTDDPEQLAGRAIDVAYAVALGVLGNRQDAADVAQEVAITAVRRRHTVHAERVPDAWLRTIAVRAAIRHARRERSRRDAESASATLDAEIEPPPPDVGEALRLLRGLPPNQRAALLLKYVYDLPDDAIGRVIGCRAATVRSLLSRGRAAVREREEAACR